MNFKGYTHCDLIRFTSVIIKTGSVVLVIVIVLVVAVMTNKGELGKLIKSLAQISTGSMYNLPDHLLFEETFEGQTYFNNIDDFDVGDWQYALNRVDSPVFQGRKAARFEIRSDQPLVARGKRSEVSIVNGRKGDIDREAWYSFAVYCPEKGYEYDRNREIINQWFQSGSPATSLRTIKDRFILETGNMEESRQQLDIGPIEKNQWHSFVIHMIHSFYEDGLIELWLDGEKIITHKGGNMYKGKLPKWKLGLYKAGFKFGTSDVDKRILYFDNVRVGNDKANYELMRPDNQN